MNEQATMMNQQLQQQQLMNMNHNLIGMNQMNSQSQMVQMNRGGYRMWAAPPQFQNPNPNAGGATKPPAYKKSLGPRTNWKGKKVNKQQKYLIAGGVSGIGNGSAGNLNFNNNNNNNYQPPAIDELQQHQGRLNTRKLVSKKKINNKSNSMNMNMNAYNSNFNSSRSAPFAPRNTTSFIIRAKKSGGIASLVSPSPKTPAVLATPIFSPSREVLVDMAKEEWGVDGYGSMKGLIRLRSSPGHEMEGHEDDEEDEGGSSGSDVEEHVEVERRLDHDLSRFEMIYNPNNVGGMEYHNLLENRVDDQDSHTAQLEEENLILKGRLFLMERELGDLRRMMQSLERRENRGREINGEAVENDSEDESVSHGEEGRSVEGTNDDLSEDNNVHGDQCFKGKGDDVHNSVGFEAATSIDVEGKEENNSAEYSDGNKSEEDYEVVKDGKESNNDDNKCLKIEVKVKDNTDIESSESLLHGGDIPMEDVRAAKKNMFVLSDVAN